MQASKPPYHAFVEKFVDAIISRPLLEDLARTRRDRPIATADAYPFDFDPEHRDAA